MDDIVKAAARHRQALVAGQKRATERLAAGYAEAWASLSRDWRALSLRIEQARLLGEDVSPAWLERQARYRALIVGIEQQLTQLAPVVATVTDELVEAALTAARRDAAELEQLAGAGGFQNRRAAEVITGTTNRGPLAALIAGRSGEYADQAARVIREAVIRGQAPGKTARQLRRVTGGAFTNAVTVARTEQMRAYREAARQSYLANPEVNGWQWLARCTERTCSYCWAQHGKRFRTDAILPTHPNCMCTQIPVTEFTMLDEPGPDVFAAATEDVQRRVLGPVGHRAYMNGELQLQDLVQVRRHRAWGPVGGSKSLTDVLGAERVAQLRRELLS